MNGTPELPDELRCTATHNPGVWPYISRCVSDHHVAVNHIDREGRIWWDDDE